MITRNRLFAALLWMTAVLACARGDRAPQPTAVEIQPSSVDVDTEGRVAFTAAVAGASPEGVTWLAEAGTVDASGNYTAPTSPGSYLLTASTAGGAQGTAVVRVRPHGKTGTPPVVSMFTANPGSIGVGANTTLSWTISGAKSVDIQPDVGGVKGDSVVVSPAATTTYELVATNSAGTTTATVLVTVAAAPVAVSAAPVAVPVINSLSASNTSITVGDPVTLTWSTTGASTVALDNGIGAVDASGSVTVTPAVTTTYALSATNEAGTVNASVTITVNPAPAPTPVAAPPPVVVSPPVINSLTATKTAIAAGETTTLSWSTSGATTVSLDQGIGAVPTNGSFNVAPTASTTYTLSATNGGGTTRTSITISLSDVAVLMQQLAAEMTGKNEAYPHGVPTDWGFAQGPVLGMGNNPVSASTGITATAAVAWGVVYEAAQGNPATNSRVNVRTVQLLFKSKSSGKWSVVQNTSAPAGANYYEDLSGQSTFAPNRRTEPDGSFSVKVGGGYMFHFSPSVRASFDPADIGGWIAIFQARLILDDPNGVDDRSIAQLLAAPGADYYPSTTAMWGPNGAPAIADGKMKYVKPYWRWYAITTLSAADLTANPPPLQLAGISN